MRVLARGSSVPDVIPHSASSIDRDVPAGRAGGFRLPYAVSHETDFVGEAFQTKLPMQEGQDDVVMGCRHEGGVYEYVRGAGPLEYAREIAVEHLGVGGKNLAAQKAQ